MADWNDEDRVSADFKKIMKHSGVFLWGVTGLAILLVLLSSIVFIPAGHEGVKFNVLTGRISGTTLKQGWELRLPYITRVAIYDCRRKDYTMSANYNEGQNKGQSDTNWSPTADGNAVGRDLTVWYRIPTNTA